MNTQRISILILSLCLAQCSGYAQAPKIGFAGGYVLPLEVPRPAVGDQFDIDPLTGDLIIQYQDESGNTIRRTIDRGMKIKPAISVQYRLGSAGLIKYSVTIQNKESAKQDIQMIAIPLADFPLLSNEVMPADWKAYNNSDWRWHMWVAHARLKGGRNTTIEFEAPILPSLITAFIAGQPDDLEYNLDSLSEWLRTKVEEATTLQNSMIILPIIGPKLKVGTQANRAEVISMVKDELMQASTLPEFNIYTNNMAAANQALQSSKVPDAKKMLANLGQTTFQKNFFEAVCFNLDFIEKLF
jgi:hypothetical protein